MTREQLHPWSTVELDRDPLQDLLEREVADTESEREVYWGTLAYMGKGALAGEPLSMFKSEVDAWRWNGPFGNMPTVCVEQCTMGQSIRTAIEQNRPTIVIRAYLDGEFVTLREINVAAWLEARRSGQ